MKKLTTTLIAFAIATLTFSQSISINGGISRSKDNDDSTELGVSLGLRVDLINFNIGESPFCIPLEMQLSAEKAWESTEKYTTQDYGTGFYYLSKYAEGGIIAGLSLNKFPDYMESDGNYLATIEYDLALGYYIGFNAIVKYPFTDQFAIFLQGRTTFKSFKSDYSFLYYDINNNLITEYDTIKTNFLHSIVSIGAKISL